MAKKIVISERGFDFIDEESLKPPPPEKVPKLNIPPIKPLSAEINRQLEEPVPPKPPITRTNLE